MHFIRHQSHYFQNALRRGVARILVRGEGQTKFPVISVRSGDIQQKFTQQRLLKNFENLY